MTTKNIEKRDFSYLEDVDKKSTVKTYSLLKTKYTLLVLRNDLRISRDILFNL